MFKRRAFLLTHPVEYDDYALAYSGGKEHARGGGMIIDKKISRSVKGYLPMSDRVILLKLAASPLDGIWIVQVYAPTDSSEEGTK